jgi:glycosyltransferase involved in cell wall biosynthesis
MPLISIIIPIYKVEQYLRRCLDSVLSQTFTNFECILIDDASPDNCPIICDDYKKKDSRFKVIHKQKNEGLPMNTRQLGLDIAIADFVMFIDSDDWIEPNAVELLYKKQRESNADIVIGNLQQIYTKYIKRQSYVPIKNHENVVEWFILCEQKYLYGRLYRKILFDDYIIPKTNILEDAIVNVQFFLKLTNDQIQFINEFIYNYDRSVNNSLLSQVKKRNYNSYNEHPVVQSLFWIYCFLKETMYNYDKKIDSAVKYLILMNGIIPYLKGNNKINKNEIHFIYLNYYKNCSHLKLLKPHKRIIIPLYRFSIIIGKFYMSIYNFFLNFKLYFTRYAPNLYNYSNI